MSMQLRLALLKRCMVKSNVTTAFLSTSSKGIISKSDLAKEIAETHELSFAKSERILNTIFDTIVEGISDDRAVRISNFGSFDGYESKARQGRNPSTGKPIEIPAQKRIRFKPYTSFKASVNRKV